MGFIYKSVFWLGLVYSAMPLGQVPGPRTSHDASVSLCDSAGARLPDRLKSLEAPYRAAAAAECAALLSARANSMLTNQGEGNFGPPGAPPPASAHSLTDADRRSPWFGGQEPKSPTSRPRQG
jgi:hypothetical protein